MAKFLQGRYKPQHPEKYSGNVKDIVYRSSYELTMFRKLDLDPNVVKWGSETEIVPYYDPATKKLRRYFTDLIYTVKEGDQLKTYLVEIKPASQTVRPVKTPRKREKTYIREALTFATNEAKWEAAEKYCKKKGWTFLIMTEKELGLWKR